jgi:transcriptional regulator with XRE-family HTH domain
MYRACMEVLAQRIKELRAERGLSSGRIAGMIGVSHKAVITWEKDRGDPSLVNLMALSRLFGVTPDYLVGMTDERKPTSGAGAAPDQAAASRARVSA